MTSQDKHNLEDLLDTTTLADLLEALQDICYEKADHLRSNWQDATAAKAWERAAKKIANITNTEAILGVSGGY